MTVGAIVKYLTRYNPDTMSELNHLNRRLFAIFLLYFLSIWHEEVFDLSKIRKQSNKQKPNLEFKNVKVAPTKVLLRKIVLASNTLMEMISIAFQKSKTLVNNLNHCNEIKCGYSLDPFFEKDISGSP
jgi:hypothetical protein